MTTIAATFADDITATMTDDQLAKALALSQTSRKAVKRLLYDLHQPCDSSAVDDVLASIQGHPREALIREKARGLIRQFDASPDFTLPGEVVRFLRTRGILGQDVSRLIVRRTGLTEQQVRAFLAGEDVPLSQATRILDRLGANKIFFNDLGDPDD